MKTVIVSVNSKYIHSSLAPWYLLSAVETYAKIPQTVEVREFTINQPIEMILQCLVEASADVYAFCSYIWNIDTLKQIIPALKNAIPSATIVMGGPEASFSAEQLLCSLPVDFVCIGEGEESFPALLDCLSENESKPFIAGIAYLYDGEMIVRPSKTLQSPPPSPYTSAYFEHLGGRIAYIEASRGCPFSCDFCLSGRDDPLRLFPWEEVKERILLLANSGTKTVKFVDRTFNCHKERCNTILRFILSEYGKSIPQGICFHFEVAADLLREDTLEILASAPSGLFQLEVGLQSFHTPTLSAVQRKTDIDAVCRNVKRVLQNGNVHLHLDLIAGLPYEDLPTFATSFNQAYALQPHMLQLGFLKLLHGSALRKQADTLGLDYVPTAPYEVTSTRWLSADDIRQLKAIEDALERLYNSGRFRYTLQYLLSVTSKTPFELFEHFANFLDINGCKTAGISLNDYVEYVWRCFENHTNIKKDTLWDCLACDCLCSRKDNRLPLCLYEKDARVAKINRMLKQSAATNGEKYGIAVLKSQKNKVAIVHYRDRDPVTNRYALNIANLTDYIPEE